jgi:hypothetical protein
MVVSLFYGKPGVPEEYSRIIASSDLTAKERAKAYSLYLHCTVGKGLSSTDAIQYVMMILMKHRYNHLEYDTIAEKRITTLFVGQ